MPLLPPNRFLYLDRKKVVNTTTVDDGRWHYNTYMEWSGWNRKRRRYIEGALYTNIFYNQCRIIDMGKGEQLDINVITQSNVESTISIIVEDNVDHPHLHHCRKLGRILSKFCPNSYRKNCNDKGNMYIVGRGKLGSSGVGTYKLTEDEEVKQQLHALADAEDYYREIGLGEAVDDIKRNKKYSNHPSMEKCFVSSITSSCNYINAAHYDVDDSCEGIITWTFDGDEEPSDWYFILPNLSVDGKKATIIKLHHGLSIKIDARIIMHCSTMSLNNKSDRVYGTFFGAKQ